jgi:SMI1 / KNR4 family (SUKH-1)
MLTVESYGTVAEADVAGVEQATGVQLPAAYRSWLLQTGSGEIGDYIDIPGTDGTLSDFLPVDELVKQQKRTGFKALVPEGWFIVATGHGGSLWLKTMGDDHGSVWWADYDKAGEIAEDDPTEEIMVRVADDFAAFLVMFD